MKPPINMTLSEQVKYYGIESVNVDALIVALENWEQIEDEAPEVEELEVELASARARIEELEKEVSDLDDYVTDLEAKIDTLEESQS